MQAKTEYLLVPRCAVCGRPLAVQQAKQKRGRKRKYCSKACKQRAYRWRQEALKRAGR